MAAGVQAFGGSSPGAVIAAILIRPAAPIIERNGAIPPRLEEIIQKALEKDRDLRYQHAADLLTDLKRLRRDIKVTVGGHGAARPGRRPAGRPSRRHPRPRRRPGAPPRGAMASPPAPRSSSSRWGWPGPGVRKRDAGTPGAPPAPRLRQARSPLRRLRVNRGCLVGPACRRGRRRGDTATADGETCELAPAGSPARPPRPVPCTSRRWSPPDPAPPAGTARLGAAPLERAVDERVRPGAAAERSRAARRPHDAAGRAESDDAAIRRTLATYAMAVEKKDVALSARPPRAVGRGGRAPARQLQADRVAAGDARRGGDPRRGARRDGAALPQGQPRRRRAETDAEQPAGPSSRRRPARTGLFPNFAESLGDECGSHSAP